MTLDKIVKTFTKTLNQLEAYKDEELSKAIDLRIRISELENKKQHCEVNALRASNIASNIKGILDEG